MDIPKSRTPRRVRAVSLHYRRSDKSWTKGEGGEEGKEHLPQDPVLLECPVRGQTGQSDWLICRTGQSDWLTDRI